MTRFAAVDVETTGFGRNDRVVEFACVTFDEDGDIIEEFDTLIQPERDCGPTNIHGITPSMVQAAPTFGQVIGDIAARLDGTVLVAHNLAFDRRMIAQEAARAGERFDAGTGVCTYQMSGRKLAVACDLYGVAATPDHSALTDAAAVAELYVTLRGVRPMGDVSAAAFDCDARPRCVTVRRQSSRSRHGNLALVADRVQWPQASAAEAAYLDVLDRFLDDHVLDEVEKQALTAVAGALGLTARKRGRLHAQYYELLLEQIHQDGVVTQMEAELAQAFAVALSLDTPSLEITETACTEPLIKRGTRVCFSGRVLGRSSTEMKERAVRAGLIPVPTVTKKGCDMLVAADPLTLSGKAASARKWGLPIISADSYIAQTRQKRR